MIVTSPDATITQILNSYILHSASLPSNSQEKIKHLQYLNDFRTQQCPLFLDHKCQVHRPFACFYWHFPNQRRRRPIKKSDGTFNYNPDVYCTVYDENTGICVNGEDCLYVHRNAGDTERRYHPRYFKTGQCIYETAETGTCVKNGQHCAFAHGLEDLRQPVYDIRELSDAVEHISNLPAALEKERVLSEDPKWNDMLYVLAFYKTTACKKPPRMCRQGYACPFFHNGKDRRRNPHVCRYRSTPCPQVKPSGDDWKDSSNCDSEDQCVYCHTRTEQQFHPEIYKSTKCNDMVHDSFCPRGPFCAFAHSEAEVTIGRDFLSNPNQLEELVQEHCPVSTGSTPDRRMERCCSSPSQSLMSPQLHQQLQDQSPCQSQSQSGVPSTDSSAAATAQRLLYNASVTHSQLGLGMLGLSGFSSATLNYLQSLLTAQSQIIEQYAVKQQSELPTVCSVAAAPARSTPFRLLSACSSDSGLSTTREDLNSASTIEQILSPDKEMPDKAEVEDKFPDINMIIGHVLGESFNCSLNEVNSLPDQSEPDFIPLFHDDKYSSLSQTGFMEPSSYNSLHNSLHHHSLHHHGNVNNINDIGNMGSMGSHAEEEDVCTELAQQFSSTSAPLSIPVNKNYRSNFQQDNFSSNRSNWTSQSQSMGSPGGSSGFGDSVPFSHNRFIDQNASCRINTACSPASRLPQSPIMIQSPFNNAACDLEKLVMEKELNEIKSKLSDTQRELHNIRHQRDVVLHQLQQSWKLIQTLVGTDSLAACEGKENVQILNDITKISKRASSNSSSPEQSVSLQSSQSTCTLTE